MFLQYDAHFLIGNYYSWAAATAGTGNSVFSNGLDASGSICPAGWQLPKGDDSYTGNGGFYNLLNQYGLAESASLGNNDISTSPLYFLRGGLVSAESNYLSALGTHATYWSGTSYVYNEAYNLYFNQADVYPAYGNRRDHGYSVRCVAPSA